RVRRLARSARCAGDRSTSNQPPTAHRIRTNTEGDRMTPTPTGQVIPTAIGRDLVLERVLPGSIDDAWASITESDRLARWFCTWTGEPRVGGTVELTMVAEEGDATFQAEILACD